MTKITENEKSDSDGLNLDEFICFAVYSAGHAFNQFYRPLLDELGLTYPQYLAMVSLWTQDDRTVKDLGQQLFLQSNTLTPLLKRLEALNLIERRRDPADERQVRVRLTETGRALRARARSVPACAASAVDMPKEQLLTLMSEITGMRDRLLDYAKRTYGEGGDDGAAA